MLNAWNLRHKRRAAGGDQDVLSRELLPINGHGMRVNQMRRAMHDRDVGAQQVFFVDAAQAGDFPVFGFNQLGPGKFRRWHRPAKALGIGKIFCKVGRVNQQFFRHAAANDTGAAVAKVFCNGHARTQSGGDPGGAHTS